MRFVFAFLVLALISGAALPAQTHPLGNFTINHLAKVRTDARGLTIRYIVDMAEIPTFQVMRARSIEANQHLDRLNDWAKEEITVVKRGIEVHANGAPLELLAGVPQVSTRPGAGGLPTIYFVEEFHAVFPKDAAANTIAISDRVYGDRIGWKDIVVAPQTEPTHELRKYPSVLLASPRDVTNVVITRAPNGKLLAHDVTDRVSLAGTGATSQTRSNLLSDMLARGVTNPLFVLLTFLLAIALGALHALEPGHGKTLLAVSLVGARATPKQALILAVALTLAHTAGVLALGAVLLALAQYIVPEQVYPWISLVSGALVALLGAIALSRFVKDRRGSAHSHSHAHEHGGEDHGLTGQQGHQHDHHVEPGTAPLSFKSVVLIAMSGNIAPCPAALVVLLTALTLHQVAYGLLVVIAFSLGLAGVLTGLGIAVVHGASWLAGRPGFDRVAQYGPLVTAIMICIIGTVMLGKASASVLQTPLAPVMLLVLAAIAGYALAPGHLHTHDHAHGHANLAPSIEKEAT